MRAVNITFQDEAELLEAVGNTGPVSVAFQVGALGEAGKNGMNGMTLSEESPAAVPSQL